jgi:hypothetical protein
MRKLLGTIDSVNRLAIELQRESGAHLKEIWVDARAYDAISLHCMEVWDESVETQVYIKPTAKSPREGWSNGLIYLYTPCGPVKVRRAE